MNTSPPPALGLVSPTVDLGGRELSHSSTRSPSGQLARCVLVALLLRWVVTGFVHQGFLDPGRDHWEFGFEMGRIARSIVTGHGFGNPYWAQTGPTAMLTPVYPYLMAAVFSCLGVQTKAAALAVLGINGLFSALTCIPVFFIAGKSFGTAVARVAMWVWAFFPYAIYFSSASMWCHSLLTLLTTVGFLISIYLEDNKSPWLWVLFGTLFGVSALTSPVALAAFPALLLCPCLRRAQKCLSYKRRALLAVLSLAAVITPWLLRNYRTFHQPVFLKDNFWMEISVGNTGRSLHWWNGGVHPAGSALEMKRFERLGELGYMAAKREEAIRQIKSAPGAFVARSLRRFVYMWTGFWSFQAEYLRQEPFDLWNIFFCSTLTALIIGGFVKILRNSWTLLPYAAVMLLFPFVYYISHPEISYRLPIDPECIIVASVFLASRMQGKRMRPGPLIFRAVAVMGFLLLTRQAFAQNADVDSSNRILGVIPDYQTVRNSDRRVSPMTGKEKWRMVWRGTSDPFNLANASLNAGLAALGKSPQYGEGGAAFGKRVSAAMADLGIQSAISGGILACLLHHDPRYFRKGPSARTLPRAAYAVTRIFITRTDAAQQTFNTTGIAGMLTGIGISNLYYPSRNRTASFMANRVENTLLNDVVGNLVSEFWPDIQNRFFRRRNCRPQ